MGEVCETTSVAVAAVHPETVIYYKYFDPSSENL